MLRHSSAILLACAIPFSGVDATSVSLSGTVQNPDGTMRSGVQVSLSGSSLSTTTGIDGTWLLSGDITALDARSSAFRTSVAAHLAIEGGRLRLSLSGRDAAGRPEDAVGASATHLAAPRASASAPDTLVYRWNGKTILRDTLSATSATGIVRVFDTTINAAITYGYVQDAQSHIYRTVAIGEQVWMAQNLNYTRSGADSGWCYDFQSDSCAKYGRLYTWPEAMDTLSIYHAGYLETTSPYRGICPVGWHVPDSSEWKALADTALASATAGYELRSAWGWNGTKAGADTHGFHALPAGDLTSVFEDAGNYCGWWTSSEVSTSSARVRALDYGMADVGSVDYAKAYSFSLRCVQDR